MEHKNAAIVSLGIGALGMGLSYAKLYTNTNCHPLFLSSLYGVLAASISYLILKKETSKQKYYKALEKIEDSLYRGYAVRKLPKNELIEKVKHSFNNHENWLSNAIYATHQKLFNAQEAEKLFEDVIKNDDVLKNNAKEMAQKTVDLIKNLDFALACLEITDASTTIIRFKSNELATTVIEDQSILSAVKKLYGNSTILNTDTWLLDTLGTIKSNINLLDSVIRSVENIQKKNYEELLKDSENLLDEASRMKIKLAKIVEYINKSNEYARQVQLEQQRRIEMNLQLENDKRFAAQLSGQGYQPYSGYTENNYSYSNY